jgi:entry exclusion lipoprotein TrbK
MMRRACIAALAAASLVACGSSGSDGTPTPFLLRVACAIERFIERDDMRVRQEGVDRCAGAARQMAKSRDQMREALRDAVEPPDEDAQEPQESDEDGRHD